MPFNNCKKCGKDCCIFKNNSGFTFVGLSDAKAIKRKIKKDYNYFLDYSPLPQSVVRKLKYDDPSLEGNLRYSQLNKNRILRLKTTNGRCIFLNDFGKCDIYNIRPNICQIYPFWAIKLINGKIKVIAHDTYPKCPILKPQAILKVRIIRTFCSHFYIYQCDLISSKTNHIEYKLDFPLISKQKAHTIIKIFRKIEKENYPYKKNIKKFINRL